MTKKILTYVDHHQGKVQPSSWEALGVAASITGDLGGETASLILGKEVESLAEEALQYGADQVFLADEGQMAEFRPELLAAALKQVALDYQPDLILMPTTSRTRVLAGMAAVDLNTGVLVDVIDLDWTGEKITAVRPIYAGKLLASVTCDASPVIITLRGRAFAKPEPDPARTGEVVQVDFQPNEDIPVSEVLEIKAKETGVSLTDAAVIVSGGRGTANNPSLDPPADLSEDEAEVWKARQGFQLISELAEVLGAAVGASRAAVDAGYIPYDHQVGQTGKVVAPDLYIACGISGAIQHLAGMRTSKVIVAVNKDPDAPIFNLARFGVVGDMFEIVPPLTESLREKLES
ncbi:MAG: electron transfer flavoprotein subunit alpha/FixB family protein [Anaerolineales bacterium]|nr:electron transfer flavoprotein subunit alpha/FixB family protein [Anaerolineales bacterium]